ncbi:MAG: alpha/beta hydrolase [Gallionella sp.]
MTTWVLLRGLMRETRHWGDFPAMFKDITGAQHVVALDFPGNGRLHAQTSPTRIVQIADYCRNELEQRGYPPPYNLLALSLGAMVAVAWNERYASELGNLVLINTSLARWNPFYHRLRPENYPALIRHLLSGSAMQRERLILELTSSIAGNSERQEAILEQWLSYARECPVTRANILRQLRAAITFRASPARPSVPVLLLAGQQDRLVNVKCSLKLAREWRCVCKVHPGAGHDLPLDDGDWVSRQVRDWLNQPDD